MEEKTNDPFQLIFKTIFLFNPNIRPKERKPLEE